MTTCLNVFVYEGCKWIDTRTYSMDRSMVKYRDRKYMAAIKQSIRDAAKFAKDYPYFYHRYRIGDRWYDCRDKEQCDELIAELNMLEKSYEEDQET